MVSKGAHSSSIAGFAQPAAEYIRYGTPHFHKTPNKNIFQLRVAKKPILVRAREKNEIT